MLTDIVWGLEKQFPSFEIYKEEFLLLLFQKKEKRKKHTWFWTQKEKETFPKV